MTVKTKEIKSKSQLIISSIIFSTIGLFIAFYYLNLDKKTIATADTVNIADTISSYKFNYCTQTSGYSTQCFYFTLDNYLCPFKAGASNTDKIEKVLKADNFVKITIEKADTFKLKTNKEIQILSLELNNQTISNLSEKIKERNRIINYLLPVLSIIFLFFGVRTFLKLLKK